MDMYNEVAVWNDPQKTVVVYPYFTSVAYTEPGFTHISEVSAMIVLQPNLYNQLYYTHQVE